MRYLVLRAACTAAVALAFGCGDTSTPTSHEPADAAKLTISAAVAGTCEVPHCRPGFSPPPFFEPIPVFAFVGTDVGEVRPIPPLGLPGVADEGLCFDIDMVDPTNGDVLGTGIDCLTILDAAADGNGIQVIGTATFQFPGGTIVARGKTSVRPKIPDHGSNAATHITMAIPMPGENSVLSATGAYEGLQGTVRLSGAVDLSRLASDTEITFDCLWAIKPRHLVPVPTPEVTPTSIPVFAFVGTDVGEVRPIPPLGLPGVADEGLCFDIDMVDPTNGDVLGTGIDCLTILDAAADGNGIQVIGTATFQFPGGTIVARGKTSVRPKIPDHGSRAPTHSTMAVPDPGENSVLSATGLFAGLEAGVRLGGAVNMSRLASDGLIDFDCLWVFRR